MAQAQRKIEPGYRPSMANRSSYIAPIEVEQIPLSRVFSIAGRPVNSQQSSLFGKPDDRDPDIFLAGQVDLLQRKGVSVIGARSASEDGIARARRIARELAKAGVIVTSGLAKGIDRAAHEGAIAEGGKTIAVIGTPLNRSYPIENAKLQEAIYTQHLLVSQFRLGERTFPSDFPKRNRLMAALTDASVIVEASDTSGSLHQAAECLKLGRWLFIMRSVVENPKLEWPAKFLKDSRVAILTSVEDVLERIL